MVIQFQTHRQKKTKENKPKKRLTPWAGHEIYGQSHSRAGSRSAAEPSSPSFRYRAGETGPPHEACGVQDSNLEAFMSLIQTCQRFSEIQI